MSYKRLSHMETKLDKFLKAFAKKDRMEERLLTMLNLSDTWVQLQKSIKLLVEIKSKPDQRADDYFRRTPVLDGRHRRYGSCCILQVMWWWPNIISRWPF